MEKINWGIIGCGDVTEVKSGPAFNKVPNSSLVAVMRRDAAKAKDYAERHKVPKWYHDVESLINDADVNAIYIATPPSSHYQYAIAAIRAGKQVYVEKPMTADVPSAFAIAKAANESNIRLVVAHYRRQMPYFKRIKALLADAVIGRPLFVQLHFYTKPLTKEELAVPKTAWRVDPVIAGGGLFHDLAPHQLDLMHYFFGKAKNIDGIASNQLGLYEAPDFVTGNILFESGVVFGGTWSFASPEQRDTCEIVGTKGTISFSIFNMKKITVTVNAVANDCDFEPLQHVQQPMIEEVVKYFLGTAANPCSAEDGALVMQWMQLITS